MAFNKLANFTVLEKCVSGTLEVARVQHNESPGKDKYAVTYPNGHVMVVTKENLQEIMSHAKETEKLFGNLGAARIKRERLMSAAEVAKLAMGMGFSSREDLTKALKAKGFEAEAEEVLKAAIKS